ncbi:A-kinase anchor protein 12 [Fukomys damarensis]|uniref:A-kinase anchor protein 12 n=1 Tax=Fukomys damarensis TaxID=885580 RepID=A0A091DZ29_FUKDA|nr:A-kinase anchor protein 12 [Fukomys damarensis]
MLSYMSKDVNGASEETLTVEVGSYSVNEQGCGELVPPAKAESHGMGAKPPAPDGCAESGGRIDKPPLESRGDERGCCRGPKLSPGRCCRPRRLNQRVPRHQRTKTDRGGSRTKGGKAHGKSEDIKPQTEEEQLKGGTELAES